jgi:histidinol dehydrogenase
MKIKREPTRLEKKARRGHRGYPVATVAFYGPDASRASTVSVGIVPAENAEVAELRRWTAESGDVRRSPTVSNEISQFVQQHGAKTVVMSPGIGCPHEAGIDYPEGEVCPQFPYWTTRDWWTGKQLPTQ